MNYNMYSSSIGIAIPSIPQHAGTMVTWHSDLLLRKSKLRLLYLFAELDDLLWLPR